MELMSTCFDKLTRRLEGEGVPEPILGKMSVATVHALDYLKERHGVIHRGERESERASERASESERSGKVGWSPRSLSLSKLESARKRERESETTT